MLKNLILELDSYKYIGIFGFGKEGQSFYNFAKKYLPNAKLTVIDKSNGENYLDELAKVDLIIKSPGISLYNLNIKYEDYNFTSITELFLKHFSKQTIGITGTKGKSTLATILYDTLKNNNNEAVLCGNIGVPAFDIITIINQNTLVVMELSSHQLMNVKYSPHISILTNLFEEHLDYYKNCDEYYGAKLNTFKYQQENDIAIVDFKDSNEIIKKEMFKTDRIFNVHNNKIKYKIDFNIRQGFIHNSTLLILEQLVKELKVDTNVYLKTLKNFKTLPHRLEYVGKINGIYFINDSISTIPQSTIEAIRILKNVNTLIVGGFDRGINYEELVKFLINSSVEHIILYSQTGVLIKNLFKKQKDSSIFYYENLEEVLQKAFEITKSDSTCLFSPAASSFDRYKNFEERGTNFKNMILNYQKDLDAKS